MSGNKLLDLGKELRVCGDSDHGHAFYDKFPTAQGRMLEIYQIAGGGVVCDNFLMAATIDKKAEAEANARRLYQKLMALKPEGLSNNEWTRRAGVSTSFFTNMMGVTKSASEPTVGNLRRILEAIDKTLPEFFLDEGKGRLHRAPGEQEIAQALHDVWDGLPEQKDRQIAYLAAVLTRALALPELEPSTQDNSMPSQVVGAGG